MLYADGGWRGLEDWQSWCNEEVPLEVLSHWTKMPNAGVGVACGRGLVLVDIDMDEVVEPVLAALPPCMVAKKGAKGLTIAFRGNTTKIKSRAFKINKVGYVDLLSTGKQSVIPPSIHPRTGLPYTWTTTRTLLDTSLAELPEVPDNIEEVIAEALKPFGYEAEPERESAPFSWDGELAASRSQSSDFFRRRNEDALANLDAWVPKLCLPKTRRKGADGWRAVSPWTISGQGLPDARRAANLSFDPKGIRDYGDGDKPYTPIDLVMAARGCEFGEAADWLGGYLGCGTGLAPIITLVAGPQAIQKRAEREAAERVVAVTGCAEAPASEVPKAPAISATPFRLGDPTRLPKREWLYGTTLIRKFISVTVAPGGVGKSSLTIVEALAMVTGRPLLGVPLPNGPLRVWLWNGEDPLDELSRRIHAACVRHGLDEAAIGDRLFIDSGRDVGLVIMREVRKELIVAEPVVEAVVAEIMAKQIDVLIVDPFVTTHEVAENDNTAMAQVAYLWGKIADFTGCAIMLVHHAKKMQGGEVTAEDARGASALVGAARIVRVLNGMTKEEAERFGISPEDRFSHVRIGEGNGKANLAPRSGRSVWFRLANVNLGNGRGNLDFGDQVGVVEEWHPPSAATLSALLPEQVAAVRAAVADGEHRLDERAAHWVGNAVTRALDIDIAEPGARKRLKGMIERLIADRHLVVVKRADTARKMKDFVEVGEAGKG